MLDANTKIDFDNIVYINRDIDIERKQYIENQCLNLGIIIKRFSAVHDNFDAYSNDWKSFLRPEDFSGFFYDHPLLSKGEIGCLLSHLEVIRLYGKKDLIVFEDDVNLIVSNSWNFKLSDFFSLLNNEIEILQMVKYNSFYPVNVKKLKIGNDNGGNWGTAAYYIKKELSKKIIDNYYIDNKWNFSKLPCDWNRKTADAVLYSFGNAYTCTLFSLADFGTSTINGVFNPSTSIGSSVTKFFNNKVSLGDYFE